MSEVAKSTQKLSGVEFTTFTPSFLPQLNLHLVENMDQFHVFFEMLMQQNLVACDTETEGLRWFKGEMICGLAFGWGYTHFYIPVRHKASCLDPSIPTQLSMDDIRSFLQVFFARKDCFTLWHNWKFDSHMYRRDGIEILTPYHDTRIELQLWDENAPGKLKQVSSGWKDLLLGTWYKGLVHADANKWEKEIGDWRDKEAKARRKAFSALVMAEATRLSKELAYQGWKRNDLKKHIKTTLLADHIWASSSKEDVNYSFIPVHTMAKYAGLDTYLTWNLHHHCMAHIPWNRQLKDLYVNEIRLSRVLMEAEEKGVRIDRPYLVDLGKDYATRIATLEKQIWASLDPIGCTCAVESTDPCQCGAFNIGSNPQLTAKLLAAGVKLTKRGKPPKADPEGEGQLVVDSKVLKKLKKTHPSIPIILEYRKYSKLKSTYIDGILDKLTDGDILHCSFNQNVKTGRMSSTDPNLQNIPARDTAIRKAFINLSDEYVFVLADYSQVEVRLTADYSQDPLLLDAYAKGQDVHTRTMCEMFGFDINEVEKALKDDKHPQYKEFSDLRTIAKRINFGIIYGVGAPGLSEQIDRPDDYKDASDEDWVQRCQEFIDNYLDKYKGVKRFISRASREIKKTCQVANWFGRLRRLPHAKAVEILGDKKYFWMEARACRQGVNFLVQGTAADVFKFAAVRLYKRLQGTKSYIINFVHDEIQMYIHKSELHLLKGLKREMEGFNFSVPLISDFSYTTTNWAAKKSIKA